MRVEIIIHMYVYVYGFRKAKKDTRILCMYEIQFTININKCTLL